MLMIETGLRGGAIVLLLLLVALLLRDGRSIASVRFAAWFALGAAANLVSAAPPLATDPSLWLVPLRILATGNPAVFWVVASALFDDDFTPSWRHATAWLGLVALNAWGAFSDGPQPFLLARGLALACVLLALWRVLAGRAGDLVETRRRLRIVFVAWVGVFTAAMILSASFFQGGARHPLFGYADTLGTLAITVFFAMALLSLTRREVFLPLAPIDLGPPSVPPRKVSTPAPDDLREQALLADLRRQLEQNRAYREESLGIAALAGKLGVPEYRLRRLINQRLGHRNFSAFLNGYRLDEVMAALGDASKADVTILTIALDAGFQSIGPFNRAFKARTGVTPSDYRLSKSPAADPDGEKAQGAPEND